MSKVGLKEFMSILGIKRIVFDNLESSGYDEEYADDKLICPYCGEEIEYLGEEQEEIIGGTTYQCPECEKWFRAEGEVTVNTTSIPLEDYLQKKWVRKDIEEQYAHDDECDRNGLKWDLDKKHQYVEWEVWKEYAEPLFENMKIDEVEND